MAEQNVPLPPKRTKFIIVAENEWKEALVASFKGFSANQVSQEHVQKAEACIRQGGTRDERYRLVPFERILQENQQHGKPNYLTSMTSAYDLLLKFVINLLKPNRPAVWRSIKTDNTSFKARVACMRGYDDILRTAGYTEKGENILQFPDTVQEPNKDKLYVIAAELLMARLEVDQMNSATQQPGRREGERSPQQNRSQMAAQHGTDGSPRQNRAQTAFVGRNDTRGSQGGQGQQYYQGSRDRPDRGNFQTSGSTTMAYDGGTGGQTSRNDQQHMDQGNYKPSLQRHDPMADSLQGGRRQPLGMSRNQFDEKGVMSSSNEGRPVGGGAFTVNLGSPSELAKQSQAKQRPVPKPRIRTGKINTSDRSANHHGRASPQSSLPSPSSSASSLYSPTTLSDSDEGSLGGGGGPRKAVAFCEPNLSAIKEGTGEGDEIEDPFVKSLRERRLAAKRGDKKNVTVAASSTVSYGGGGIEQIRPRTTGHALRHDTDPQGHSPSLSEFRQSLSPGRMHRQRPTTPPSGRSHGQTTPPSGYSHAPQTTPSAWQEKPATPPIPKRWSDEQATPSGRSEETSDDSSSEKFSTPPTTISPIPDNREQEVTSPATPPVKEANRSTSVDSTASEHEAHLDTIRRRRLRLKEEREKSSEKKKDTSPPMTETKSTSETFPPSQAPTHPGPESEIRSRPYDSGMQRESTVPQATMPTLTPDGTGIYCPGCKCKVRLGQKKCDYCQKSLYPYSPYTASTGSEGSGFVQKRPGANVTPAAEGVDMSGYATPLEPRPQYPRDQYYHPDPNAPALPPKPAPKVEPYGKSDLFDALGNPIRAVAPDDVPSQQPPPVRPREAWVEKNQMQPLDDIRHYDRSHLPAQKPPMAGSEVGPSGMSYALQGENGPEHESSQQPSASGGASRPPLAHSTSGIEQIRYKLQKFREHLKKSKGLTDYQIDSDPDYIQMRESETHKYREEFGGEFNLDDRAIEPKERVPERKRESTSAGKVDPRRFHKVNTMEMSFPAVSFRNVEAMEQLKEDGEELLTWIKRCVPFEYSLDEIQVASDFVREGQRTRSRNPLEFLDRDWAQMTRSVQDWVAGTQSDNRPFVGKPTEDETRKALVETSGDVKNAVDIIYKNRKNKIEALLKRFKDMRAICPTIEDLAWKSAVDVLCVNGMDVDKACYAVQCEWLQPLYDSINSEHKKIKKDEMKEIKMIVSKKDELFAKEARCRMLMAECDFDVQDRAQMVLDLMEQVDEGDNDYPLNYYVDAAHDFDNFEEANKFLFKKECPIQGMCAGQEKIPIHEMITMPGCTCSLCKECFIAHFTMVINEQQVKHFNCPICGKPDMSNKDADTQEMYELMFVSMIKQHLDSKTYELCQDKLKEFNLSKDPEFLWCADDHCDSGFIYEGDRTRPRGIQCLNCKNFMCWKCKKPWEAQHEGISCEQFTQWKLDNDPEAQELGLAAHLNDKGIECPACHAKYELARGGCMHFKCTKCPNEFCSGCGESMKKGKECGKYDSCATRGLHAHHPRDCLFFLRDFPVRTLQDFLKENKQEFDTEAPKEQIEAAKREKKEKKKKKKENGDDDLEAEEGEEGGEEVVGEGGQEEAEAGGDDGVVALRCRVEEQKEDPDGLRDEICGRVAEEGHAGLCNLHYREYLVNIINKNGLDPITMYELGPIRAMLMREEMEVPDQEDDEDEEQYRERLIEHVQARLNLTGGRKAGEAQAAEGAAAGEGDGEGDEGN